MRIIVCDTGPLLHMNEAGIAHLIPLAGSICIPPAVVQEYKNNAQGWNPPPWVQVLALDRAHRAKAVAWSKDGSIDFGEAEATALTLQIKADWLLSDDARARQFAQTLGLEVHGSIGLLLWATVMGHISSQSHALDALNALAHSSLWISDRVLHRAKKAIQQIFFNLTSLFSAPTHAPAQGAFFVWIIDFESGGRAFDPRRERQPQ